jgi:PPOX class probable F420-dependent enzyme
MPELTSSEVDWFLEQAILARIATVRPDGRPHVVPVWFWWDGTSIYVETPPTFVKARNLMANPRCAFSIDITEGGLRFKAVILEGKAQLIHDKDFVVDMVTRIYTKYLGVEGVQSPTPHRMIHGGEHVIIKVTPDHILSWDDTRVAIAPIP